MPRGLPIGYIKKWGITKLAWRKFREGALTKGVPTRTAAIMRRVKSQSESESESNPRKRRSMAKKKKSRRRSMTIPLAPVIGLACGLADPAKYAIKGDWKNAVDQTARNYLGYSIDKRNFSADRMIQGVVPLILGLLVHKFVGGAPLNLNRTLARAGVPFIRI